jgi:hypothetical protein
MTLSSNLNFHVIATWWIKSRTNECDNLKTPETVKRRSLVLILFSVLDHRVVWRPKVSGAPQSIANCRHGAVQSQHSADNHGARVTAQGISGNHIQRLIDWWVFILVCACVRCMHIGTVLYDMPENGRLIINQLLFHLTIGYMIYCTSRIVAKV